MAARELDTAAKEQLRRIDARRIEAAKNIQLSTATVPIEVIDASRITLPNQRPIENVLTNDQIASFYYRGSALDLLPEIAKTQKINHIICDPPYGIGIEVLAGGDERRKHLLQRIQATHKVEDNLLLIPAFLEVAFNCIAEDGFLCMWYDLDHHEKIATWAEAIGWKVCRWPLTWCKTSPCLNQAAQYNITKATEVCYIMRRSEKSFIKQKQTKNYVLTNSVADATHPFTKPQEVWDYLVDTVSLEGETICDPFAGQGSSLVRFFKKNRNPIGIEIEDTHIANGINYIATRLGKVDAPNLDGLLSELPL
jgi:DNA modification methylase